KTANGEIMTKVAKANEDDINKAIKAGDEAFKSWSKSKLSERIKYVEDFNKWMVENEERFLDTILLELGSPKYFSRQSQFRKQVDRVENFLKQVKTIDKKIQMEKGFVNYEPIGLIAAITPWNYPLGQIIQKVIPAILTGNTVVLKPASITPL